MAASGGPRGEAVVLEEADSGPVVAAAVAVVGMTRHRRIPGRNRRIPHRKLKGGARGSGAGWPEVRQLDTRLIVSEIGTTAAAGMTVAGCATAMTAAAAAVVVVAGVQVRVLEVRARRLPTDTRAPVSGPRAEDDKP